MTNYNKIENLTDEALAGEMLRRGWLVSHVDRRITQRKDLTRAVDFVCAMKNKGVVLPTGSTSLPILDALLRAEGKPVLIRTLGNYVWGKKRPRTWISSIRVTIVKLRSLLRKAGYDLVCQGHLGYVLREGEE